MDKYLQYNLDRSALITIDTQNDFTQENAPAFIAGTREVIPNMVRLLSAYRQKCLPIIHVVRFYLADGSNAELCRKAKIESGHVMVVPGSEGAELVAALKPDRSVNLDAQALLAGKFQQIGKNEFVMYKPRWGAFYQTNLEQFLGEKGINTLLFSGCNFPNCPRTSLYEASERDFRLIIASDAMSQLYAKGEDELKNIGVTLLTTSEIVNLPA